MAVDLSCRLIFLASPGGLEGERATCRRVILDYHASRSILDGATFFVHAWEDVPGGVGRPQDLINSNLDSCDFLVMLLGESWGSPPAGEGGYSSGTEEEFYRALQLLADAGRPMRDILVLFKTLDPARLRDPGDKLKPVLDFRAKLEASHSLTYQTFDSDASLARAVERKLQDWCKLLDPKQPVTIDLPRTGVPITPDPGLTQKQLLESAQTLARRGLTVQAEAAYASAISGNDPHYILDFAKFMRRTGRLSRAKQLNDQVLQMGHLLISDDPLSVHARASALANIGVIQRNEGDLAGSLNSLREAVSTARTSREPIPDTLCYALDNYGFTLLRTEFKETAPEVFQEAYELRKNYGTTEEKAQSAINLGHLHIAESRFDAAIDLFDEALSVLQDSQDQHLRANALCGAAESRLRRGEQDGVDEILRDAIHANETLQNSDGLSITHSLMTRLYLAKGDLAAAETHLEVAREKSQASGNTTGIAVVAWLSSELARMKGDTRSARVRLERARHFATGSHSPTLEADIARSEADLLDER